MATSLTPLERDVIELLLAGDHPVLRLLRRQVDRMTGARREFTGVGFYCDFVFANDAPPLPGEPNFVLSDVGAELPELEHGAGFALFVRGGRLVMLEGFTYGEEWPSSITSFQLKYERQPRDLSALGAGIADG